MGCIIVPGNFFVFGIALADPRDDDYKCTCTFPVSIGIIVGVKTRGKVPKLQ